MPSVDLGLNDKQSMSQQENAITLGVDFEDVKLHKCVDLKSYREKNVIKFVPPDGEFELMTYHIKTSVRPLFTLQILKINESSTKLEFKLKIQTNFKVSSVANDVEVFIPAACDLYNPHAQPSYGQAKYAPDRDCFVWKIPVFKGEQSHYLEYKYSLPTLVSRKFLGANGSEPESVFGGKRQYQVRDSVLYAVGVVGAVYEDL